MAVSLADIAAKAGTYPAFVKDYGRTIAKFAESVVAHVASAIAGPLAPSTIAIPSKTAAELAAIDDATVGDTYLESDTNKLAVFTAVDAYNLYSADV